MVARRRSPSPSPRVVVLSRAPAGSGHDLDGRGAAETRAARTGHLRAVDDARDVGSPAVALCSRSRGDRDLVLGAAIWGGVRASSGTRASRRVARRRPVPAAPTRSSPALIGLLRRHPHTAGWRDGLVDGVTPSRSRPGSRSWRILDREHWASSTTASIFQRRCSRRIRSSTSSLDRAALLWLLLMRQGSPVRPVWFLSTGLSRSCSQPISPRTPAGLLNCDT